MDTIDTTKAQQNVTQILKDARKIGFACKQAGNYPVIYTAKTRRGVLELWVDSNLHTQLDWRPSDPTCEDFSLTAFNVTEDKESEAVLPQFFRASVNETLAFHKDEITINGNLNRF